ncbi:hypothetical protein [Microbispora corallina]|uniref:hypothetical protein n=1 Tax=Microbispora corallina TaxID=83302 RepID=UPI0031D25372
MAADLDAVPESATRGRRRWGRAVAVVLVLPLLYAFAKMPEWIHNRQMDDLAGRILSYPPPPSTGFASEEFSASFAAYGMKDTCTYRLRFDMTTKLSADEITHYYETAAITPVAGGEESFAVKVWTLPQTPASLDMSGQQQVIVEIQDRDLGSLWDFRCM